LILSPEGAQRVLVELKNMLENYYSEE